MDLALIIKNAAYFGLACGVAAMAGALLFLIGAELLKPSVAAAATTTASKLPFGFCPPNA